MQKMPKKIANIPAKPGIYQFFNKKELLYIGKAKNLKNRVKSYWQKSTDLSPAKQQMLKQVNNIKYTVVSNETEALLLEKTLINKHQPPYNIDLKDDKYFLYIKIDLNQDFPQLELVRRFNPEAKVKYFGPYVSAHSVHQTIKLIKNIFFYKLLKNSSKFTKQGIYLPSQLENKINKKDWNLLKKDYKKMIEQVVSFLSGDMNKVIKELKVKMDAASQKQSYEKAATYRDQVEALEKLQTKQRVVLTTNIDEDFIAHYSEDNKTFINLFRVRSGKLIDKLNLELLNTENHSSEDIIKNFIEQYYPQTNDWPKNINVKTKTNTFLDLKITVPRKGDKKHLLEIAEENAYQFAQQEKTSWQKKEKQKQQALRQLQKGLELDKLPQRIEMYDISNIQGQFAVGAMTVITDGEIDKSQFRKFQIKSINKPDDPGMMMEVLVRRLQHKDWPMPDLIVLDGGKSQLSIADKLNLVEKIKIVALAKQQEILYTRDNKKIKFKKNSPADLLIRKLRDEAHRQAISYYKKKHQQQTIKSELDNIKGIGPATKKILKQKYGSWDNIRQAPEKELIKLIGKKKTMLIKKSPA